MPAGRPLPDHRCQQILNCGACVIVVLLSAHRSFRHRDQEGLYALADSGQVAKFPSGSKPYEAPEKAQLVLPTHELSVTEAVDCIVALLDKRDTIS